MDHLDSLCAQNVTVTIIVWGFVCCSVVKAPDGDRAHVLHVTHILLEGFLSRLFPSDPWFVPMKCFVSFLSLFGFFQTSGWNSFIFRLLNFIHKIKNKSFLVQVAYAHGKLSGNTEQLLVRSNNPSHGHLVLLGSTTFNCYCYCLIN